MSTGSQPRRSFTASYAASRPAVITFAYVDRPELVDDFLKPPSGGATGRMARFRYRDRTGASRTFDWTIDEQEGKSIMLPDSDLTVTLVEATSFRPAQGDWTNSLERTRSRSPFSRFKREERAGHSHGACQSADGTQRDSVGRPFDQGLKPRWRRFITWSRRRSTPRRTGGSARSTFSPGPDEALYYRVFGRGKEGEQGRGSRFRAA